MNNLKRVRSRVCSTLRVQRLFRSYVAPESDVAQSSDSDELRDSIRNSKERTKLVADWEKLELYGPKVEKPKQFQRHKSPSTLVQELRNNLRAANLKILGNAKCSDFPEQMLHDEDGDETICSVFENLQSAPTACDNEFPLFTYRDVPQSKLQTFADEIWNKNAEADCKAPSVATVLNYVMSQEKINRFQTDKLDFVTKHGVSTFYACRDACISKKASLHKLLQTHFEEPPSSDDVRSSELVEQWNSVNPILNSISDVALLEADILHPFLNYHGTVGCVGIFESKPSLIEFVVSNSPVLSGTPVEQLPLKLVALLGLVNTKELDYKVENIVLVLANRHDIPATTITIDKETCEKLWNQWVDALRMFWRVQRTDLQSYFDIA